MSDQQDRQENGVAPIITEPLQGCQEGPCIPVTSELFKVLMDWADGGPTDAPP